MKDEHKANERQVMDSEESFNTSTDFNNDCVFLFNSELNCIEISKAALQLFPGGTRKKDVIGKHLLDISPGLKETGRYNRYVEVLKTGIPISEAINVPGPKFADVSLSAYIYPANDGLGIAVSFATDSGDLGQVVEEIREAEERYSGLVEGINDIVYVLDDKAIVTYISPIIESIVGYNASEIVGRNVSEYIYPEDLLLVIQRFQSGSFANIPEPFEFRLLTKSGEMRWVRNMPRTLIRKNRLIGYQGVLNDITDSKRAEEDLIRSGQQFQALIENTSDAIVIINPDATVRYESPSMEKLTGRKARSRIGKNALEFCHPDDVMKVLEVFVQLVEGKIPVAHMEIRLKHKNGKWITFELVGTNLIDDPAVAGIVLNMRDISERKEAEERLIESENRYRTLVDSIADVIIEFDLNGKCTYCSPQIINMIGYEPEEVIGWHVLDRVHPEDRTMLLEKMGEANISGEILCSEYRLQHKDGHYCVVATMGGVIKEGGETVKYVGSMRDITESRQLEEALKQSEEQYRTLVETMNDGLAVRDKDGLHIYVNDKYCEMTGYSRAELIGHSPIELMDEANQDILNKEMMKRCEGKSDPYELEFIRKDGLRFNANISPQVITDSLGEITGNFAVITDITKAREAEKALRKSEQNLKLAQEIAHMGYWEWDSSTNEVVLSEEMQRIVGYDRAQAKFSGRPDIIHPDDIVKLQYAIEEARKGGSPIIEFRLVLPNGDTKWVQAGSTYIDRYSANGGRFFGYALDITDSKRMGEALKDSEETLKQAQHLAQVGSWTWNLKDNSFMFSGELSRIYGTDEIEFGSFEEVVNEFIHPDDRKGVFDAAEKVLTDGYGDPLVYRIIKPDGEVRWMSATIPEVRHFDIDGNPEVMVGAVQDITWNKQAEEAVRESEAKLRTVFDNIGDGITVLDLAGNIVDVNETVLRIKGYNREDVIGRFGLDFVAEEDHARATEEMMVLFNGDVTQTPATEYALLAKDGSKIPCEASASLLRDGDGNVVGLISVERDLRERKETESNLQESENLLTQAEKLAGIGSWQWNLRTNTVVRSEGMRLLYGIEGKEFAHLEDAVETLIHPDDREEVLKAAAGVVLEGSGKTLIYRIIRPDGEVRWLNATIPEVRRFGEDGKPEIVFGAVQDITERKQAEQQLKEREERWKLFSESATDVFTIWDSKLNLIDNSERGIQTFYPPGTRIDDLIGKNMLEFIPDEEKTGRYRDYLNVIKTGKPYFADDVVPHHKFGDRHFSIKAFKVGEGLGTIVTDITEHKRAERQLQESEERLRAFMDSSTDVYTIWDSQLRLVDVSDKGVKAFLPDKTREEQIGKHISEIVPEVMETGRYEEYLKVIETGKPFQVEEAIIHPRFALRNISINAFKVQDGMGQVVRDITQRVQAEQKLKENEERLRFFMESATDVFNIWDSNLNLVYTPEKGLREFFPPGTKKEDILGKNLSEIVPDIKKTGRYDEYLKVIETGKPFIAEDVVPNARFGDRHISIKAFKSGNDMGQVITDITRQKQADEQLRSYAERIRAMAKQLSEVEESQRRNIAREMHDSVGQNLTVLGINFSRAKTQMAKAKIEEAQSILDDSQQLLEQTTESIRNVMADLRPPVLEDYGLLAALRGYGDLFASRNEISVTVEGEEPDPRMGIELEIVLFRIAQEALTNIAKHAKASNVTMNFDIKDGIQRLVITDDGVGFDTDELSKYKEQTSWGMVTMSERAQSIGGSLSIESHPGGGTQIIVEVVR